MDFTVGGTVENRGGRFIIVDSITLHSLTSTPARIELDQVSANVPIVMTPEFSIGNGSLSTTAESTGAVIAENVHNFAGSISGNLSVELLVRTTGERGTFTNEADVSPGNSPGTIQILGNFEQTGSGHLLMEIAGTTPGLEHDQLLVSGEATLGGELEVVLLDGFTPSAGGLFDLFDWGSVVGTFEVVSLPALGAGLQWDTTALYTQGQLCVLAVGIPGDYNHNGIVDAADYTVYRNNAGTTNGLVNDPIGGTIGLAQYDQWKAHFGQTAGSGAWTIASTHADAAVPEPTSIVLILLVATVAIGIRSRLDRIADGHRVCCLDIAVRRYLDRRWLLPFLVLALLGTSVCHADLLLVRQWGRR